MKTMRRIIGVVVILLVVGLVLLGPAVNPLAPGGRRRAAGLPGGAEQVSREAGTTIPLEVTISEPSTPTLSLPASELPQVEEDYPLVDTEMYRRDDRGFTGPDVQMPPHDNPLMERQNNTPLAPEGANIVVHFAGAQGYNHPPDDTGDVGPNHYVQGVNTSATSRVYVYDKAGTLQGSFYMEDLAPDSPCNNGYCDPIIQYDQMADRWMISEFDSSANNLCVYVSETPDPLGAWYAYDFNPPGGMQDYPKYGVWPDGYYVGVNNGGTVIALERTEMLLGNPAQMLTANIGELPGWGFQLTLPATHEGPSAPPAGAPGIFMRPRDTEIHGGTCPGCDLMEMWEFALDWGAGSASLTQLASIQMTDWDQTVCGTVQFGCMPQPGTGQLIDPIREPLHFPVQYRNFGTHETLVSCFVEDIDGTDHVGVHWFEIRRTPPGVGAWALEQEGVLGSPDTIHRGVCAAAMDGSGNIVAGYTRTGPSAPNYPSIYYSARLSTDPLGTMPLFDQVIYDANSSHTGSDRWGDYAGIGVDPTDDCTIWFTTEYGGSGNTRIAGIKFDECGYPDFAVDVTPDELGICAPDDAVYNVEVNSLNNYNDWVTLSTVGAPGSSSFSPNPVRPPAGGTANSTLTISGAAAGSYTFDVQGDDGFTNHVDTVDLNVYAAAPAAATLLTPADGSTGVSITPNFTWNDVANEAGYTIEIATDPGFGTIIDSASLPADTTSYNGAALNADTVYYWRVRASNACGNAESAIWAFRTEAAECATYGPGETGTIRDASVFGPRTTSFDLNIPDSYTIIDVNVIDLRGTHTWISDLEFNLDSPANTGVQLINRMCGDADNFDKDLDDEAANPVACPLNDGLTQRPAQALSAYDGENSIGTWTLNITDHVRGDSGNLAAWNLEICFGSGATSADYSDLTASYGIAWHTDGGSDLRLGSTWDADVTFGLGDDDASDDGVSFITSFQPGQMATVRVNVQGTPANGRWLRLWFDWDQNGVFDDDELEYEGAVNDGNNDISVNVQAAPVYYRARLYDSAGAPAVLDPNSYGGASGGEVEDNESSEPTAVQLSSFEAFPVAAGILLTWETESEFENLGFNLYRSATPDGLGERLNEDLIPSQAPGEGMGASYAFLDETAETGVTYYYTLEDVDWAGQRTQHGPVVLTLWRAYLPLVWR